MGVRGALQPRKRLMCLSVLRAADVGIELGWQNADQLLITI